MINGVNFGAISTDPTIKLQDSTIAQANNNSVAPAAAAEVQGDSFEKKGKGGKAVGFLATVAAALTTLALLVKYKKLTPKVAEEGESLKFVQKAINALHTVGKKTLDIVDAGITRIKNLFGKGKEAVNEIKDESKKIPVEGDPEFIGPPRPRPGDENFIGPLPKDFVKE